MATPNPNPADLQGWLEDLTRPELALIGLELVDLELLRGGGRITLRFFIEKSEGEDRRVDVDDCARASRAVGLLLDAEAQARLTGRYVVEVSSPGIFRRLRQRSDFERFVGEIIKVVATAEDGTPRELRENVRTMQVRGSLASVGDDAIEVIDLQEARHALPYNRIRKAHLDPDLTVGKSPRKGDKKHGPSSK